MSPESARTEVDHALAELSDQGDQPDAPELERTVEALLFLSTEPVSVPDLADACEVDADGIGEALEALGSRYRHGERGIFLREIAGGFTFATDARADAAARRLLAKPKAPAITQAQLECLSVAAYLGPVSRPDIARVRGVNSESTVATLVDRGLLEECSRSSMGAVEYRTTRLMERQFGLAALADLPEIAGFDATLEERERLRERLFAAGDARFGSSSGSGT